MGTFFTITLTLFFVIDALGNIPAYLHLLKPFDKKKRRMIALRELGFALILMLLFQFIGDWFLTMLSIDSTTVQLAGGIMLFLIAIRLIFANEEEKPQWKESSYVVPIATPMIASPSVLAIIMVFSEEFPGEFNWIVSGAIFVAWLLSSLIFLCAQPIFNLIKEKGLDACQRLMGLIVALIAVQLFIEGVIGALK